MSDSSFTIAATAITVNSPSNGKSWAAGTLQTKAGATLVIRAPR